MKNQHPDHPPVWLQYVIGISASMILGAWFALELTK